MQSITAQKKIDAIVDNVNKKGIIAETMIKELKELREMAQLEKDPLIVKTLRLVYSYIEDAGSFDLNLLEEDEIEEIEDLEVDEENKAIIEEEVEEEEEESYEFSKVEDFEEKRENFLYFLGLIKESENEYNRKELKKLRSYLWAEIHG